MINLSINKNTKALKNRHFYRLFFKANELTHRDNCIFIQFQILLHLIRTYLLQESGGLRFGELGQAVLFLEITVCGNKPLYVPSCLRGKKMLELPEIAAARSFNGFIYRP